LPRHKRVLAIGAHTDDIELGCGAYLNRLSRDGSEIALAAFSRAEQSLPSDMARDTLEVEFRRAAALLGVTDRVYMGTIPVRHFPEYRQQVLEELVTIRREFAPDLVLTMNSDDSHQDHAVVHAETTRAFRGTTVLGYETPWNQRTGRHDLFVEVQPEDIEMKIAMLNEYKSQITLERSYIDPEFVTTAARFRGYQGRLALAEMYEVITMVWRDLDDIR
jgi:LmbE family N-acetylglucosaminyl deacetylase